MCEDVLGGLATIELFALALTGFLLDERSSDLHRPTGLTGLSNWSDRIRVVAL